MTSAGWRWPVYLAYQREEWTQWRRALLMLLPAVIVVLAAGLLAGVHPSGLATSGRPEELRDSD